MHQPERRAIRIEYRIRRLSESVVGQVHLAGNRRGPNHPMKPDVDTNRHLCRDNGCIVTRHLELPQTSCRTRLGLTADVLRSSAMSHRMQTVTVRIASARRKRCNIHVRHRSRRQRLEDVRPSCSHQACFQTYRPSPCRLRLAFRAVVTVLPVDRAWGYLSTFRAMCRAEPRR